MPTLLNPRLAQKPEGYYRRYPARRIEGEYKFINRENGGFPKLNETKKQNQSNPSLVNCDDANNIMDKSKCNHRKTRATNQSYMFWSSVTCIVEKTIAVTLFRLVIFRHAMQNAEKPLKLSNRQFFPLFDSNKQVNKITDIRFLKKNVDLTRLPIYWIMKTM